ncbi:MAG TPA: branched-chain amino acid ABC transporter permease [Ktedonobacteraceae bacterium]|nr:branched-chain amino acid ABC transporter permease [Ktedonobacteraceae bacterium]
MSMPVSAAALLPARQTRTLLIKWTVALLVPLIVFTFIWSGEAIVNTTLLGIISPASSNYDTPTLIQLSLFILLFYAAAIAFAAYLIAVDTGRRGMLEVWLDVLIFAVIPLFLVMTLGLIIGLALSALIWGIYFYVRNLVRKMAHITPPPPLQNLAVLNAEQRAALKRRAVEGGFWFATVFAVLWLVVDLIFFFSGTLPVILLIWVALRTILLPVAGYFLGRLSGTIALRRALPAKGGKSGENGADGSDSTISKRELEVLSTTRAREEAKDLVPNDLPLRSAGAQRFFMVLLVVFLLFYPVLDPILFGSGTNGRLAGYGDAGFYVILALGLNIVVGFAGLLDLGYVAFFAIGAYVWGMVGSTQLNYVFNIPFNATLMSWLFWPFLIVAALIAALWGVLLGAPTLRLRGDYLAIVTLGFGEIVPVVFLEMDKYTNGANGIVGVQSPSFPGVIWSLITPIPYYYLILVLIGLTILANIRLRDSRLGRAWIAIREDEIAAASSGVNLVRTKLFAFASGAFFSGIAGMYHAAKLGGVSPDNFSFGDSVIYLAMVVIGGIGNIPGVIVGALVVYSINEFILAQLDTLAADPTNFMHTVLVAITHVFPAFTFGNIRNLVFGIILIVIMIFRPEGLIPSARRRRELRHGNDEEVEVGSLDVPPGTPAFESEVHVE